MSTPQLLYAMTMTVYTLHDSDDEEEAVREDAPSSGHLSAMSPAISSTMGTEGTGVWAPRLSPPPPPLPPSGYPQGNPAVKQQQQRQTARSVHFASGTTHNKDNKQDTQGRVPEDDFLSTIRATFSKVANTVTTAGRAHPPPPAAPPGYPLPDPASMLRRQQLLQQQPQQPQQQQQLQQQQLAREQQQQQKSRSAHHASGRDCNSQASPFLLATLAGDTSNAFSAPAAAHSTAIPAGPVSGFGSSTPESSGSNGGQQGLFGASVLEPEPAPVPLLPPVPSLPPTAPGRRTISADPYSEARSQTHMHVRQKHRGFSRSEFAPRPSRTWTRKVDTNILNVDMSALGDAAPFATGDPTICKGCGACLSAVSILKPAHAEGEDADMEGIYGWTCEFCGEVNRAELDDMERPVEGLESVDYVLEAAPVAAMSAIDGKVVAGNKDKSAVLFVVDTSGSMCVTTAVPGRISLRGDRTKDLTRLLSAGDDRNQLMPGQRGGVTYVSRLQSMQAAIYSQLEIMADKAPSRHAGLVTFNGEVSIIGDGSGDARVVAGDRLSDAEALREVGRAYPLSRPVSEARDRLTDRLFALEEGGPTALGPAVVAGLSMLKERGGRGSRVVVCTDGMANVGLGALDDLKNDQDREAAENFYAELGRESAENGVTVDVVSVDSDACDLENLGAMADVSGGTVTKVKASELSTNFAGILANPILASQVSVRVTLHKGLVFRNADAGQEGNTLVRDVGNVTRETELSFEYQVRRKAERRAMGLEDNGVVSSPAIRPVGTPGPPIRHLRTSSAPAAPLAPSDDRALGGDPKEGEAGDESAKTKGAAAGGEAGDTGEVDEKDKGAATAAAAAAAATSVADVAPAMSSAEAPASGPAAASPASTALAFLPFQVQIRYTRPDGMKCMRVLTRTQRVTKSKAAAESSIQMSVVAGHAASQAGNMASKGAYHSTRVSMRAWSNLMQRNSRTERTRSQVERYSSDMAALDSEIVGAQSSEAINGNDEGGTVDDTLESRSHGRIRKAARSGNDNLSYRAYSAKGMSGKRYN